MAVAAMWCSYCGQYDDVEHVELHLLKGDEGGTAPRGIFHEPTPVFTKAQRRKMVRR